MNRSAACVLGLSPTGLYVAREAAAAGVSVYGYSDAQECGGSSRLVVNRPRTVVSTDDQLESKLEQIALEHDKVLVIPTTDRHVEFLARSDWTASHPEAVAGCYRSGVARQALDKNCIATWADEAGILLPREMNAGEGDVSTHGLAFPLLLKPRSIHKQRHWLKGRKLLVCRDQAELDQHLQNPNIEPRDWTLQELVAGPESGIVVVAAYRNCEGELLESFSARKIRQYPPGYGSASLLESFEDAEAVEYAHRLLEVADFRGIAGVEFKRDSRDGKLRLIEMNPRPCLWFSAATAHGTRLVHRQLGDFGLIGKSPVSGIDKPVVWRYGLKDHYSSFYYRFRSAPGLPNPNGHYDRRARRAWAVWDKRDKGPFIAEFFHFAAKGFRRVLG